MAIVDRLHELSRNIACLPLPHQDMRSLGPYIFITIVIALLAQSLSLALNQDVKPHVYNKLGSKIDHKREKSYDIFPGTKVSVHPEAVFLSFWLHGFRSAIDPFRETPPRTNHPMSRSAWDSSHYYRAGLNFHRWGIRRAAWEAHRYDRYFTLEFLSKTHMVYAIIGYWAGRLFFFSVALGLLLALAITVTINKTVISKIPSLSGARIHS